MVDRRTRAWRDIMETTPSLNDLLGEVIDGTEYHYVSIPQCYVCSTHPELRRSIEKDLLWPLTIKETYFNAMKLWEALNCDEEIDPETGRPLFKRPTQPSIRNHAEFHMPTEKLLVRKIVERRAREQQLDYLEGSKSILTAHSVMELIAQKGWEELVENRLKPDVKDTMAAVLSLKKLEDEASDNASMAEMLAQFNVVLTAIKEVCPPEVLEALMERIDHYSGVVDAPSYEVAEIESESS